MQIKVNWIIIGSNYHHKEHFDLNQFWYLFKSSINFRLIHYFKIVFLEVFIHFNFISIKWIAIICKDHFHKIKVNFIAIKVYQFISINPNNF